MRDVDKILLIRESLSLEKILSEIEKLFEIFNERKYLVDTLFNLRKVQSVLNIIVLFFFFSNDVRLTTIRLLKIF